MKYIKKYKNELNSYYAIRWLNLNTNEFGEAEGRYNTILDALLYNFDIEDIPLEKYDKEFIIVKITEEIIDIKEIEMNIKTINYNL